LRKERGMLSGKNYKKNMEYSKFIALCLDHRITMADIAEMKIDTSSDMSDEEIKRIVIKVSEKKHGRSN